MKTATFCPWTFHSLVTAGIIFAALLHTPPGASAAPSAKAPPALARTAEAIPRDQIGAEAGADYKGDGLTVTATATGARLHCVFQRLEGEATREGLWLTSTGTNQQDDRFRVTAVAVGAWSVNRPSGGSSNSALYTLRLQLFPAQALSLSMASRYVSVAPV